MDKQCNAALKMKSTKKITLQNPLTSDGRGIAGNIRLHFASSSGRIGLRPRRSPAPAPAPAPRPRWKEGKKNPLVCFCLRGAPVDASSHHMSDRSCQSTGQRDPGEVGTGGERSNSGPRG